jgi:hypothetical protein
LQIFENSQRLQNPPSTTRAQQTTMRFLTLTTLLATAALTSANGNLWGIHHHDERAFMRHGPHHISVVSEAPTGIDVAIFADAPIPIPTAMPAVVDDKKEMSSILSKRNHGPHHVSVVSEAPTSTEVPIFADAPFPFPTAMPSVFDNKKEMLRGLRKINHATLAPEVTTTARTLVTRVHPRAFSTDKAMQEHVEKWHSIWKDLKVELATNGEPMPTSATGNAREIRLVVPFRRTYQACCERGRSYTRRVFRSTRLCVRSL